MHCTVALATSIAAVVENIFVVILVLRGIMHLKFPRRKHYYEWEELSCLARALGFHHDVIKKCLPERLVKTEDGITHRELMKYIDLKYFNDALDRTANMHTADYNINVLRKSVELLNHRLLSFDELSDVRVAFQVYEAGNMRGMVIDKHVLMRTLKLSGRTVAPLKLMHRVKHMEDRLDEPGRLQLYEFLDLIVLCELIDKVHIPQSRHKALDKTWRKLFKLDNFEDVFMTSDQKLEGLMNSLFIQEERNYGKERLGSSRIPKEGSVETSTRKKLVIYHQLKYKELNRSIDQSTAELKRTKAGTVRPRPLTAADEFRSGHPAEQPRPHTVAEFFSSFNLPSYPFGSRPHTAPASYLHQIADVMKVSHPRIQILLDVHRKKSSQSPSPWQQPSCTSAPLLRSPPMVTRAPPRAKTPVVVTEEDIRQRQQLLDSLEYEMETLEQRSIKRLEARFGRSLPSHHRQRQTSEIKKTRPKSKRVHPEMDKGLSKHRSIERRKSQTESRLHRHYKDSALEERLQCIREQKCLSERIRNAEKDLHNLPLHHGRTPVNNAESLDAKPESDVDSSCGKQPLHDGKTRDTILHTSRSPLLRVENVSEAKDGTPRNSQARALHDGMTWTKSTKRSDSTMMQQLGDRRDGIFDRLVGGEDVCRTEKHSLMAKRGLLRPSVVMRDQFEGSRVGTAATLYNYLKGTIGGGETDVEPSLPME